ncbi:sarcosine oxidase subunit gamma [Aurantimonas aggregata]|uniref:Sarcosine oxidase subunit gamma n=1 Tax=Aurantimonas aggregata TaxID=2047720 RepID=A0A6L9MF98_9HYPH|nr:sarcosine oxidase subunit gamma family protein [Aurantimonas aggregata]NDV86524.1 sarcosine oxidase subunit gamma [Aurantimonas aggregata]
MADLAPAARPVLAFAPLGTPETPLRLVALPEGRVIHALATVRGLDLTDRLAVIAGDAPFAVRAYAPGQWFLVEDTPLAPGDLARLAEQVTGQLALSDQSHGRVRLSIEGPAARHLLAKGTGVNLGESAFPVGHSAPTLYGHVGIHLTRTAPERYELLVLRSFAVDLWEQLAKGGAEFLGTGSAAH